MNATDLVPIPANINAGVQPAGNRFMSAALGNPRSSYGAGCAAMTNPRLVSALKTRDYGPFKATGYGPATESLAEVMADIESRHLDIFRILGTAGMLCARLVRGSKSAISNHSWGTAIDLTIGKQLDARGNGKVQYGLTLIAPIFNAHGWYWGAGFGIEDGMHFEAGRALVQKWAGMTAVSGVLDMLDLGDRGPAVVEVQRLLNGRGEKLSADGVFGPGTRAALVAFQAKHDLDPDGVAGPETLAKLRAGGGGHA